jgi:choline dehydrogenase-like flavoprotein
MPGGWAAIHKTSFDWGYDMVPQKGANNRVLAAPRGRFLGGCSAINGTLIIRGAKADYDRIANMGNPGWSWEDMLPYFKASETFHPAEWHQADLSVHGTNGPLHTEPQALAPISEKILESFIDCGFEYKPDMFVQGEYEGMLCLYYARKYRSQTFLGVGHAIRSVHNGIRSTSADFVHNSKIANLTVKTGIFVDRIIVEKNNTHNRDNREYKAIGVEAHDDANGQPIIMKARKEIILSAG